jgi:hypothetical protein
VTEITRNLPTAAAQRALQDFENLAAAIGPVRPGADARYLIRLLSNAHLPNVGATLRFLDKRAVAWPALLKKLHHQTSESQFRQTLAELRVLSHLNQQTGVHAQPASTAKNLKHHDIDVTAAGITAKIEIYSPSDVVSTPLVDRHIAPLFKFLDVSVGFHLELTLEPLGRDDVNHASEIGTTHQIARWLTRVRGDAETWINASTATGASKTWNGPNKAARLTVTVSKISDDHADRVVTDMTGTRSTGSSTFFDHGDPQQLRSSPWGKRVFEKMSKRQCGEYEYGQVRLLIIDFAGLDSSPRGVFGITGAGIFSRIESALKIAAADAGELVPYDGAMLAWVGNPIAFAPAIELHPGGSADLQKFVSAMNSLGASSRQRRA